VESAEHGALAWAQEGTGAVSVTAVPLAAADFVLLWA
jgi:hypothetical protein